jgi:hypothetical protein
MTAHAMPHDDAPPGRRFGLPVCPRCSDVLLAPAVSEHVDETLVRHFWACESCGHEFETAVRLTPGPVRRRSASIF